MRIVYILILLIALACALPQNIFSEIKSALGLPGDAKLTPAAPIPSAPSSAPKTLVPPATVNPPKSTQNANLNPPLSIAPATTRSGFSTSTPSSTDSASTSTDSSSPITNSSTITPSPTTASIISPATTPQPTQSLTATTITAPPSQPPSSNVPPGGIAVAVIMSLAVVAGMAWVIFRHHPRVRRWWLVREEKRMQERSYRAALDGPVAGRGGPRNAALGTPSVSSRKSFIQSFFAPRTVQLGNGQEIRRKPVNWGVTKEPPVPPIPRTEYGIEKLPLTNMAAPMARTESVNSGYSHSSRYGSNDGTGGMLSNVLSPAIQQKELPPMPELPSIPELPSKSTVAPRLSPLIPLSPMTTSSHFSLPAELSPLTVPTRSTPSPALLPSSAMSRQPSMAELGSTSVPARKPVPKLPPVPAEPQSRERDMHRILTRKSIFELA